MDELKAISEESTILVDGSFNLFHYSQALGEYSRYIEIPPQVLETCLEYQRGFIEIISKPNARTIPGITKELKDFRNIVGRRIHYLNDNITTGGKILRRFGKNISQNQATFQTIQELSNLAYKISKEKEIVIEDPLFKGLKQIVKELDIAMNLRKSHDYEKGESETQDPGNNYTDDHLTSTFYWLLLDDKDPLILTSDWDYMRLLGAITPLFCAEELRPYNDHFRQKVKDKETFVFHMNKRGQIAPKKMGQIFPGKFCVSNIGYKESQKIKEEVACFFQAISQ